MNHETITEKQGIIIIIMFIIGSSLLMVMGLEAEKDIWIAIILALLVSIVVVSMYARLLSLCPGKDIFETLETLFGKIISRVLLFPLIWFAFDLSAIVLRNMAQFVMTVGLVNTPMVVIMICFMTVCSFAVKAGFEMLARWCAFFILVLLLFIFGSIILLIPEMDWNNLQPTLLKGFAPVFKGAFTVIAFPFTETVVFLLAFPVLTTKNKEAPYKIFILGLILGGIMIFLTSMTDVLVIGVYKASIKYYPTYSAISRLHFGEIFRRLEIIAASVFILSVFLKVTILQTATLKGLSWLIGCKDHRFLTFPVAFLIINQSYLSFQSMPQFHNWVSKVFPFYGSIFEIIVPTLILILSEIIIRTKKHKKASTSPPSKE